MNIVTTVIKSRHSVRKFKTDKIDETILRDALECASLAPTARNIQPWLFGVVRNPVMLANIAELTENGRFIAESSVCFTVFGEKDEIFYLEDCCAATENLILALQAYGVSSCWVAGDKKPCAEPVRKLLHVPEKYTLVSLVAAGNPAEIMISEKKDKRHIVFYEEFKTD